MARSLSDNRQDFTRDFRRFASQFSGGDGLPPIILMTDEKRDVDWGQTIAALPRNATIIFRHYEVPNREALGRDLRAIAKAHCLPFLVAGDPHLARRLQADGLHLPEALIGRVSPLPVTTAAAHNRAALVKAAKAGIKAVLISPVFPTQSHPDATTLGVTRFTALATEARALGLAPYALGGVDHETIRQLKSSGAAGVAAIGALINPIEKD